MPRTRRAPAPAGDANEPATLGSAEATPEIPSATDSTPATSADALAAEGAAPEPTTSPRPRRRRTTKTADAPTEPADPIAPVVVPDAAAEAPEVVKPRRTRRKTVTAEPTPVAEAVDIEPASLIEAAEVNSASDKAEDSEAVVSGSRSSRRRRRGRRDTSRGSAEPSAIDGVNAVENIGEAEAGEGAETPGRRSRRRGRQSRTPSTGESAVPIAGLDDIVTPVTPVSGVDETAELPSPVRRGRSRRRKPVGDAVEAASAGAEAETPAEETESDESGRRSRRSRRGGRRRRGDDVIDIAESSSLIVGGDIEEDLEAEDEEELEDDLLVNFPPPPPPVYVAPPLVRPVEPSAEWPVPSVSASVVRNERSGHARIDVNGNSYSPCFFFVNAETATDGDVVETQIRHAAAEGVHLYSSVMYLPLKNAYGERTFGPIDAVVQQVLSGDPDGYIVPRLQFVPTNYWVRTHHDQLARYSDGSEGDVSLASTEFWSDCVDALEALIAHFADPNTPGGDRVIGFHLDRGEWFYDAGSGYDLSSPNRTAFQNWLHAKYQFPYELRAAWYDGTVTFETADIPSRHGSTVGDKKGDTPLYATQREGRWVDYAFFSSELVASVITGLASAIKTLSDGRLLVAVSYGYTLEFSSRNDSGHLAMGKVLASEHIDIVAGPNAYTGRGAGSAGAFGLLVDSIGLHKKLWLMEDDTKTYLADIETPDSYNPRVQNPADTAAVHQRNFAAALTHKAGTAWMDLWGQGWLNDELLWRSLGGLRRVGERWGEVCERPTGHHDVIAIVDEASLCYLRNDPAGVGANLIGKTRELLLRTGASVGFYLQSDLVRDDFPDAPLYLFLNAFRITTGERAAIREKLQRPGRTLAWLYAPGLFDEDGPARQEIGEIVGMTLRLQPWNAKVGSQLTDIRHPLTERVRSGKRIGQEEVLNPSFAISDAQATVLAEYVSTGAPSVAVREHSGGWKAAFFGDPHITVELLRGLFAYAGVPLFDTQDDIVMASRDGSLLLHAPYTGQRTVHLPEKSTVYDVAEDKIVVVDSRSFRTFLRARTSRLFLFGSSEMIARATGLEIPAASPPQPRPAPVRETPSDTAEEVWDDAAPVDAADAFESDAPRMIPGLDTIEPAEIVEGEPGAVEPALEETTTAPAPRSRWQRRRAAARARRDAERKAKAAASGDGNAAPVDIATLLPDLPPRLPRPEGHSENGAPEPDSAGDDDDDDEDY